MDLGITTQVVLLGGLMAVVLGAVANKTNFCAMGAVSDWVNLQDTGRIRSWVLAMAVAILGVSLLEAVSLLDADTSRIPYRRSLFFWPRYVFGGLMFGVGMTLASGCGNKNLVRIGEGNLKSILVVLVTGAMAYVMTWTDFYAVLFHSWMEPISPDIARFGFEDQSLGSLLGTLAGIPEPGTLNVYLGVLLFCLLLFLVFRSREFRSGFDLMLGGVVVGLVVVGGWYVTGGPLGQEWMEAVDFMDEPPPGTGTQSYTFINPMNETLIYLWSPTNTQLITFGVAGFFGVIAGSLLYALYSGRFQIVWFADVRDFVNHMIGAVLMGTGGVLAMGCTIGQGVTGVSTLALGSFVAMVFIILGSALTLRVEYYRLVYEDQASFPKALTAALVDLRLLPERLRKLEAV